MTGNMLQVTESPASIADQSDFNAGCLRLNATSIAAEKATLATAQAASARRQLRVGLCYCLPPAAAVIICILVALINHEVRHTLR